MESMNAHIATSQILILYFLLILGLLTQKPFIIYKQLSSTSVKTSESLLLENQPLKASIFGA